MPRTWEAGNSLKCPVTPSFLPETEWGRGAGGGPSICCCAACAWLACELMGILLVSISHLATEITDNVLLGLTFTQVLGIQIQVGMFVNYLLSF